MIGPEDGSREGREAASTRGGGCIGVAADCTEADAGGTDGKGGTGNDAARKGKAAAAPGSDCLGVASTRNCCGCLGGRESAGAAAEELRDGMIVCCRGC